MRVLGLQTSYAYLQSSSFTSGITNRCKKKKKHRSASRKVKRVWNFCKKWQHFFVSLRSGVSKFLGFFAIFFLQGIFLQAFFRIIFSWRIFLRVSFWGFFSWLFFLWISFHFFSKEYFFQFFSEEFSYRINSDYFLPQIFSPPFLLIIFFLAFLFCDFFLFFRVFFLLKTSTRLFSEYFLSPKNFSPRFLSKILFFKDFFQWLFFKNFFPTFFWRIFSSFFRAFAKKNFFKASFGFF